MRPAYRVSQRPVTGRSSDLLARDHNIDAVEELIENLRSDALIAEVSVHRYRLRPAFATRVLRREHAICATPHLPATLVAILTSVAGIICEVRRRLEAVVRGGGGQTRPTEWDNHGSAVFIGEEGEMATPWKRFATLVAIAAALGLMLSSLGSAATSTTVVSEIPITSLVFDSCTGETVTLTGSARIVFTQTTGDAGGLHVTGLLLGWQVTGTGLTGTSYRLISTAMSSVQQSSSGLVGVTFLTHTLLVSAGSADNQAESIVTRFTVTPSGQVTQIAMSTFGCQG